jgi:hypothetical protein
MHEATYEIRLRGQIPPAVLDELGGTTYAEVGGETLLLTLDIDQQSLHDLVAQLRDLGIELLELRPAAAPAPRSTTEQP